MTEAIYRDVGRIIARERKKRGYNQTQLAKLMGISRGSVANIEVGRQRIPTHRLFHIAYIFDCEIIDLVPYKPPLPTGDDVEHRIMEMARGC